MVTMYIEYGEIGDFKLVTSVLNFCLAMIDISILVYFVSFSRLSYIVFLSLCFTVLRWYKCHITSGFELRWLINWAHPKLAHLESLHYHWATSCCS